MADLPGIGFHTEFAGWNNPQINSDSLNSLFSQIRDENWNLQRTTWEREDTAYQRMVEDMRKAGLNPWTGVASSGSSTSAPVGSPTGSAMEAFLKGWQLNAQSQRDENNNTNKLLGNLIKLASLFTNFKFN